MKTKLIPTSLVVTLGFLLICLGNAAAMEVASDTELASVEGMAICLQTCYKVKNGDMCYGPPRYGAACNGSHTLGAYCTDIVSGPSKHDVLVSYPDSANLATTWCKKYEDGVCVLGWDTYYCDESGPTVTNGTMKYGTGKKCPWYW